MPGLNVDVGLLAAGLFLDILGVCFLAVPDVPWAARRFRFGRLRAARSTLEYGGLTSDENGFKDIVRLHDESQPNIEITIDDVDRIEYGPKKEWVFHDGDIVDWEINHRVSFEYANDAEFAGMDVRNSGTPPENFYPKILRLIERGERKFRFFGLVLIGLGFTSQFIAIWVS